VNLLKLTSVLQGICCLSNHLVQTLETSKNDEDKRKNSSDGEWISAAKKPVSAL